MLMFAQRLKELVISECRMEMASAGKVLDSSNLAVYLGGYFLEFCFPRKGEGFNHASELAFGIASKGLAQKLREVRIQRSQSPRVRMSAFGANKVL